MTLSKFITWKSGKVFGNCIEIQYPAQHWFQQQFSTAERPRVQDGILSASAPKDPTNGSSQNDNNNSTPATVYAIGFYGHKKWTA